MGQWVGLSAVFIATVAHMFVVATGKEWKYDKVGISPPPLHLSLWQRRGGVRNDTVNVLKAKRAQVLRGGLKIFVKEISVEEVSPGGSLLWRCRFEGRQIIRDERGMETGTAGYRADVIRLVHFLCVTKEV